MKRRLDGVDRRRRVKGTAALIAVLMSIAGAASPAAAAIPVVGGWAMVGRAGGFTVTALGPGALITRLGLGGAPCSFAFDLGAPISVSPDGTFRLSSQVTASGSGAPIIVPNMPPATQPIRRAQLTVSGRFSDPSTMSGTYSFTQESCASGDVPFTATPSGSPSPPVTPPTTTVSHPPSTTTPVTRPSPPASTTVATSTPLTAVSTTPPRVVSSTPPSVVSTSPPRVVSSTPPTPSRVVYDSRRVLASTGAIDAIVLDANSSFPAAGFPGGVRPEALFLKVTLRGTFTDAFDASPGWEWRTPAAAGVIGFGQYYDAADCEARRPCGLGEAAARLDLKPSQLDLASASLEARFGVKLGGDRLYGPWRQVNFDASRLRSTPGPTTPPTPPVTRPVTPPIGCPIYSTGGPVPDGCPPPTSVPQDRQLPECARRAGPNGASFGIPEPGGPPCRAVGVDSSSSPSDASSAVLPPEVVGEEESTVVEPSGRPASTPIEPTGDPRADGNSALLGLGAAVAVLARPPGQTDVSLPDPCASCPKDPRAGRTVFAGHGTWKPGDGYIVVPPGTSITFYAPARYEITDRLGNAIERGVANETKYHWTYREGQTIENLTLSPGNELKIETTSVTVTKPTKLQDLLRPGMGECAWAACRKQKSDGTKPERPYGPLTTNVDPERGGIHWDLSGGVYDGSRTPALAPTDAGSWTPLPPGLEGGTS